MSPPRINGGSSTKTLLFLTLASLLIGLTFSAWLDENLNLLGDVRPWEPEGYSVHTVHRRDVNREIQECKPLKKSKPKITECKKKGKYPVQDECRTFLNCKGDSGKPVPTCCPEGLHFDHRVRQCIGRQDAHCLNMCKEPGTKYPDPKNLKQYLECGELGIPEEKPCGEKEHFSAKDNACKPGEVNTSAAEENGLDSKMIDDILQGYEFPPQVAKEGNATANVSGTGTKTKNGTDYETDEKGNAKIKGVSEAPDVDYAEEGSTVAKAEGVTEASLPLCSAIAGLSAGGSTTPAPGETTTQGAGPSTTDDDEPDCIPDEEVNMNTTGVKKTPQGGRMLSFNFEMKVEFGASAGGGAGGNKNASKGGADNKKGNNTGVLAKSQSGCRPPTKKEEQVMPTCPKEESYPIKNECKLFRKCYGKGKAPVFTCCPEGMKFHHVMRVCVQEKNARCTRVCPTAGIKYPHPKSQKMYLMCTQKGWPEDFECKEGTKYDNTKKECIPAQEAGKGGAKNGTAKASAKGGAKKGKGESSTGKAGGGATGGGGGEVGANGGNWTSLNKTDEEDVDSALLAEDLLAGMDLGGNSTEGPPGNSTGGPGGDGDEEEMPVVEEDDDDDNSTSTTVAPGCGEGNSSTTVGPEGCGGGGSTTTTGAPDGSGGGSSTTTGETTTTAAPAARRRKRADFEVGYEPEVDGGRMVGFNELDDVLQFPLD